MVVSIFLFLFGYLIVRSNTVFFIHDEIATKWSYIIEWNPLPYQGHIDANNHFLNSLLGGFFYRLLESDSLFTIRLANIITFPIYFWTVYSLRSFFSNRINFLWLFFTLVGTAFIIEFFGMARGYGMSIAFFTLALTQTFKLFKNHQLKHLLIAITAWSLATYASLTLLPIAIFGMSYLALFLIAKKKFSGLIFILIGFIPLVYGIQYAFHLKDIGKLYGGGHIGFFNDTVHTLTKHLWNSENLVIDILLTIAFVFILATVVVNLWKSKNIFEHKLSLSVFLIVAVANILFQNWFLDVLFPEDRAALYLVVLFFIAFCTSVDYWNLKWIQLPFAGITAIFFCIHFSTDQFVLFDYEHFDKELLTKTQEDIQGIPPSIGGPRNWKMDNELTRMGLVPFRAMQLSGHESDTIEDYIITSLEQRPDVLISYHPIYNDEISELTLFKRNEFLKRTKTKENSIQLSGSKEYTEFINGELTSHLFLRVTGHLDSMSITNKFVLVFSSQNKAAKKNVHYEGLDLIESCPIDENGSIEFDFTFSMDKPVEADRMKVYLWNKQKREMSGEIKLEVYRCE